MHDVRLARPVFVLALFCLEILPSRSSGDGAFPDSKAILLPADRPDEIILSTNFGLVLTTDAGTRWHWLCEAAISAGAPFLYQLGPSPESALFAVEGRGLHVSPGDACGWSQAMGDLGGAYTIDVFPDATNARRVLALGYHLADGGATISALYESLDGGHSFHGPLYVPPRDYAFTGVEISRSNPDVVYLTVYDLVHYHPYIARSQNRGADFTLLDELPFSGSRVLRLAAVDPDNADKLYVRGQIDDVDALLISDDGGKTARIALQLEDRMTAFLRRANGTLLVGTSNGHGFRSSDGGKTFTAWLGVPHLRGMGERAGRLYAAADNFMDGYALAVSDDEGAHYTPLLHFKDICGPLACPSVMSACAAPWEVLVGMLGIAPPAACNPAFSPDSMPAISDMAAGGAVVKPAASGCACRLNPHASDFSWLPLIACGVALSLRRSLRYVHASSSPSSPLPHRRARARRGHPHRHLHRRRSGRAASQ